MSPPKIRSGESVRYSDRAEAVQAVVQYYNNLPGFALRLLPAPSPRHYHPSLGGARTLLTLSGIRNIFWFHIRIAVLKMLKDVAFQKSSQALKVYIALPLRAPIKAT